MLLTQRPIQQAYQSKQTLSERQLGVDIALSSLGATQVTGSGDLPIVTGNAAIEASLKRRLTTPSGGYTRIVNEFNGAREVDTYQNAAYASLSSGSTPALASEIESNLEVLALLDPRITAAVATLKSSAGSEKLTYELQYQTINDKVSAVSFV